MTLDKDCLEVFPDENGGSTWLDVGDSEDVLVPGSAGASACQLYFASHQVHWIQHKMSLSEPERVGRLVAVEDNVVAVDFFSEVRYYRNHEADRMVDTIGVGGTVSVVNRYFILRGGGACFSIQDVDEPWVECDFTPLTSTTFDALAERIRTHGGYSIPGQDIVRQLNK